MSICDLRRVDLVMCEGHAGPRHPPVVGESGCGVVVVASRADYRLGIGSRRVIAGNREHLCGLGLSQKPNVADARNYV